MARFAGAVPAFLYGTAWKEDATEGLVTMALRAGARGIDTANQRKHYFEAAVGEALKAAFSSGIVRREDLFVQTKFTHRDGQDDRLPYDEDANVSVQVRQSFESSLDHLGLDAIDSYVLHGPSLRRGLAPEDREAWRAMEDLHAEGRIGMLGASNVSAEQLRLLCDEARTPPSMVQNRCYARAGWDREVRAICRERNIRYQGFSLLTANATELRSPTMKRIANRANATAAEITFRFAHALGMICLTGTTNEAHLRADLASDRIALSPEEIRAIEQISG